VYRYDFNFLPGSFICWCNLGRLCFAGFYGVAIAASAMMATTAMQLAIDAFGPIADNAGGIAEMSELPKEVRKKQIFWIQLVTQLLQSEKDLQLLLLH
jgi:K(+)-stimulated pyrophosphate-energized sodium pump